MHSEAKQIEMSEFGTEEDLLQDHAWRQVACAPLKARGPPTNTVKHF